MDSVQKESVVPVSAPAHEKRRKKVHVEGLPVKDKSQVAASASAKSDNPDFSEIKARVEQALKKQAPRAKITGGKYTATGVPGVDELFEQGIPNGSSVLVVGGPGSGKTIFCLQTLYEAAKAGQKVFYMTLEEKPERLREHMRDFGWDIAPLEKAGLFVIKQVSPIDITRQVDAMLEKMKGELLIDIKSLIIPEGFAPDRVAVDSLSAIAASFFQKEDTYRLYVEQLFALFSEIGATSFLISETTDPTKKFSVTGTEEFLADGVLVFYNVRHGNVRESAFEVLKMRGSGFKKRIVALQITSGKGIVVFPEQEVFAAI